MLFKTCNNVPEVYANTSRDFQLIANALDSIYNTSISNQLKINYIDDIEVVDANLLSSIAKYLGFFTSQYYPEDLLRAILMNFPAMIKNKGSYLGVQTAVKALQNAYSNISYIDILPQEEDPNYYIVRTNGVIINQNYIDEVLKYVLPIGAIVDQTYVVQDINTLTPDNLTSKDELGLIFFDDDSSVGDGSFSLSSIRNSNTLGASYFINTYFSKVGQTPIIKGAITGTIKIKKPESDQ